MRDTAGKTAKVAPAGRFFDCIHHEYTTGRRNAAIDHEVIGQAEILHLHAIGIFPNAIAAPLHRAAQIPQAAHGEIARRIAIAKHGPAKGAHEAKLISRARIS